MFTALSSMLKSAMALIVISPMFAQTTLQATIPFDFHVGGKHLQAGDYKIKGDTLNGLLYVRSDHGGANLLVPTLPGEANRTPEVRKLIFNRYGEYYFLSEVWGLDSAQGRVLRKSSAEREVARTSATVRQESARAITIKR